MACGSRYDEAMYWHFQDHSVLPDRSMQSAGCRTAEMLNVSVSFVRGKKPDESMLLEMARDETNGHGNGATVCSPPAVCCTRRGLHGRAMMLLVFDSSVSRNGSACSADTREKYHFNNEGNQLWREALVLTYDISADDFTRAGKPAAM